MGEGWDGVSDQAPRHTSGGPASPAPSPIQGEGRELSLSYLRNEALKDPAGHT